MLQENFNFRWFLTLNVQTGSDQVLKTGTGYDHVLTTGSGSDLISKTGFTQNPQIRPDPHPRTSNPPLRTEIRRAEAG